MDLAYFIIDKIFKKNKIVKFMNTALKSVLTLRIFVISQFYILQHFATKHGNFTIFKMLLNAVVINFAISIFLDVVSIMLKV